MISASYYFKKGLSANECAGLVKYALQQQACNGTIGYGGKQMEHEMRRSTVRWLYPYDLNLDWLKARTEYWCLKANAENFGIDTRGFLSWQFTEYHGCDKSHYDWHRDDDPYGAPPFERKLSMVVQLSRSKDYEGGLLELDGAEINRELFCDQGDVIIFRSDQRHRVTQTTSGIRFSLVSWMIGPRT